MPEPSHIPAGPPPRLRDHRRSAVGGASPRALQSREHPQVAPGGLELTPLRGVKILVVEDYPDSRELSRQMLEGQGAVVSAAADGAEALRKIAEECPELILCDLVMPVMDGYEVARRVRGMPECAHVRLVALTALRDTTAWFKTWSVGYDAHLEKPLTYEKLDRIAAQVLLGRQKPPKPPSKRRPKWKRKSN